MPYPKIQHFRPNSFQRELLHSSFTNFLTIAETAVRTGKTGAMAAFHRYQAKHNPGCLGLWVVTSYQWFKRIALPVCRELFGHEAKWHGTEYIWTWPNGARVMVLSYEYIASWEGATAAWVGIDECQDVGRDAYEVAIIRLSEARSKYPHVLITGLPIFNSWAQNLAESDSTCGYFVDIGTDVNAANVHPAYIERLKQFLSPEEFLRRTKGQRPMPRGRVYSDFVPELWNPTVEGQNGNLVYWQYRKDLPTYCGLDFGRRACAVFEQNDSVRDVDILFAELHPDDISTELLATRILDIAVPRHLAKPNETRILVDGFYADPAGNNWQSAEAAKDIEQLRNVFGTDINYTYDSNLRRVRNRVELCKQRVFNAAGKRRQLMDKGLWESGLRAKGRSMAKMFTQLRYPEDKAGKPVSDEPLKDGINDHPNDGWGYIKTNRYGRLTGGTATAHRIR